jgi:hypothetical protein
MATKLKIVEDQADIVPPPVLPQSADVDFTPAPTRKRHADWTAERQRISTSGSARWPTARSRATKVEALTHAGTHAHARVEV